MNLKFYLSLIVLLIFSSAQAADIGGVRAKPAEFTASVVLNSFDVERCIINRDSIGIPIIYRQPDRPDDVTFVWQSSDFGNVTVLEMHRQSGVVEMKFWGRNKAWRKIQPCIGKSESEIP